MATWLIEQLDKIDPARRKIWAANLFIYSTIAMIVNVSLYLAKVIDQKALIVVTLVISWFAIQLTAIDVICSTDVRDNLE